MKRHSMAADSSSSSLESGTTVGSRHSAPVTRTATVPLAVPWRRNCHCSLENFNGGSRAGRAAAGQRRNLKSWLLSKNRVTFRVTIHNNFICSESFSIADRFDSVGIPLKMIALAEELLEILNRWTARAGPRPWPGRAAADGPWELQVTVEFGRDVSDLIKTEEENVIVWLERKKVGRVAAGGSLARHEPRISWI